MDRRGFNRVLAGGALGALAGPAIAWSQQKPAINAERLRASLEALGKIGRDEAGGISRLAWTQTDLEARRFVAEKLMPGAGLSVRRDPVGNIYGRREGTQRGLPVILFGSHIDTVPQGGMFDGALGSMAAIEVMHSLQDSGTRTRHPLECVVWVNEEGARYGHGLFGSGAAVGESEARDLDLTDEKGVTLREAVRNAGGDTTRIAECLRKPGEIAAYLELHIEQGGVLEKNRAQIGVVEGIVGIKRYEVKVEGFANHAGTTPMTERRDALVAASRVILAVREEATRAPGRQVGTVGRLSVTPNAPNVVPGRVDLVIEIRDLSESIIDGVFERIQARMKEIAQESGTAMETKLVSRNEGAPATPWIRGIIKEESEKLGMKTLSLPSGAGHDAQMMARIAPMGMIFVPSVGGISHSPKELTLWQDCANGCEVLYRSVLAIDGRSSQ